MSLFAFAEIKHGAVHVIVHDDDGETEFAKMNKSMNKTQKENTNFSQDFILCLSICIIIPSLGLKCN